MCAVDGKGSGYFRRRSPKWHFNFKTLGTLTDTMSLFHPVFNAQNIENVKPLTSFPSSSSSSFRSSQANRPPPVPYTTMLSQLHQALSTVPDDLSPSSRPSTPSFQARSAVLQKKIEDAVQNGKYAGDLVKLWCTRRRAVAPPRQSAEVEPLSSDEYILPDTEEEWFGWEKAVQDRRMKGEEKDKVRGEGTRQDEAINQDLEACARSTIGTSEAVQDVVLSPLGFTVVKRTSSTGKAVGGKPPPKANEPYVGTERDAAVGPLVPKSSNNSTPEPSALPTDTVIAPERLDPFSSVEHAPEEKIEGPSTPSTLPNLPDVSVSSLICDLRNNLSDTLSTRYFLRHPSQRYCLRQLLDPLETLSLIFPSQIVCRKHSMCRTLFSRSQPPLHLNPNLCISSLHLMAP